MMMMDCGGRRADNNQSFAVLWSGRQSVSPRGR